MLKKILLTLLVAANSDFLSQVKAAEKESEETVCGSTASNFLKLPGDTKLHIFSYLKEGPSFTLGKKTEFNRSIRTKSDLIHSLYGYAKGDPARNVYLLFLQIKIKVDYSYRELFPTKPFQRTEEKIEPQEIEVESLMGNFESLDFISSVSIRDQLTSLSLTKESTLPLFPVNELVTFGTILSLKELTVLNIDMGKGFYDPSYFIKTLEENKLVSSTVQEISCKCTYMMTLENIHVLSSLPNLTHLKLFGNLSTNDILQGYNQDSSIQSLDISYVKRPAKRGVRSPETFNEFTKKMFEHLAGAKNLTHLNVTGCKLGDKELAPLLKSSSLHYLILSNKIQEDRADEDRMNDNEISQEVRDQFKNTSITIIDPQGDLDRQEEQDEVDLINSISWGD